MQSIRNYLAAIVASATFSMFPMAEVLAQPTETTQSGTTAVKLSPDFLNAITSLKVAAGAISPGKLSANSKGVKASFPITTGAADLGTLKAEISHKGGLSLSAGKIRVELTSFVIDLAGNQPVLTGLVTANDSLVGRVPLFDLNIPRSGVRVNDDILKVSDVEVTLTEEAATALNSLFGVNKFTEGLVIGTANVRAMLEPDRP